MFLDDITQIEIVLPLAGAALALLLAAAAEWIHARRVRRTSGLAFGPTGKARRWTSFVPAFRTLSLAAMTWSLLTLLIAHLGLGGGRALDSDERYEHVVFLLDYSPSMMLVDAGPDDEEKMSRKQRMRDVVNAIVDRFGEHVNYSLIAFYTRPYPICENVFDRRVVRNMLNDLPIETAMESGPTDLGRAVNETLELTDSLKDGKPKYGKRSITLILVTDGDTLEMPELDKVSPTIRRAMVLGVGDTEKGIPVGGHLSRQEPLTLRYIARHLGGEYVNVNSKHLSSATMSTLRPEMAGAVGRRMTRTGVALVLFAVMAAAYALLPVLLDYLGSDWRVVSRSVSREETP